MGHVYVLTNPAMPGMVKIGKTTQNDVSDRIGQLYSTGVPLPFDIVYVCKTDIHDDVEKALHIAFRTSRINSKREFFSIEPEQAIAILKLLHVEDKTEEVKNTEVSEVTQVDENASKAFKARRPNFDFSEMGISDGAELRFTESDEVVLVHGNRRVIHNGQEMSLNEITKTLLGITYNVQATPYWTYNGRTLKEIYDEINPMDH